MHISTYICIRRDKKLGLKCKPNYKRAFSKTPKFNVHLPNSLQRLGDFVRGLHLWTFVAQTPCRGVYKLQKNPYIILCKIMTTLLTPSNEAAQYGNCRIITVRHLSTVSIY